MKYMHLSFKTMRLSFRRAALLTGVVIAASSCDTRLPTQGGHIDDVTPPTVKLSLSTGPSSTIELGTPVTLTVTATDDNGVSKIMTT